MIGVFIAQCQQLIRNPKPILLLCALTVIFALALGANVDDQLVFYVFADGDIDEVAAAEWINALNDSTTYTFVLTDKSKARTAVAEGRAELAVKLLNQDYRILALAHNPNVSLVESHVNQVYTDALRRQRVEQSVEDKERFQSELKVQLQQPVLTVSTEWIGAGAGGQTAGEDDFIYNNHLQALFGFTLFFSIYTIGMCVNRVLEERRMGIWDRMILSPLRKSDMYLGHLSYSFMVGFGQMLFIFLLFKYVFQFDLGVHFGAMLIILACYTFAIVALCLLLTGLVKTPEQFNSTIPLVSVSIAMLGGAYWPIEIVTNPILLKLSKVVPIYHAMEGLKKLSIYNYGLTDVFASILFLIFIGVICMGVGINLMERRHV